LFGGIIASSNIFQKVLFDHLKIKTPVKTYTERLLELTANLTTASGQVDSILRELSSVAQEKEGLVTKLERSLQGLENREQELRKSIEILQGIPLPVAEQFSRLVAPSEKRSAKRDYILFGAGVVSTTIISLIIQLISK
jgi:septal ring factor EnvC (AmiA/AmiB activator)